MGPDAILALKMITDLIMTLAETANRVANMKDDEVNANIEMAESMGLALKKRRQSH